MVSLRFFGGASIEGEEGPLTGPVAQRHRLALLALLSSAHPGGLQRDKLVAYLWPERSAELGRNLLNQAAHAVRKAAGDEALVSTGDELRLDLNVLYCDVVEFEAALEANDPERAVELYRGPFLDGFFLPDAPEFERWAESERGRLARAHAEALERLAEGAESEGELQNAVRWWRAVAAMDPCSSRVALRFMRALAAAGDRAAALEHVRIHRHLLEEKFGVEPDPAVLALAEELRTAPASGTPARSAGVPSRSREPGSREEPGEKPDRHDAGEMPEGVVGAAGAPDDAGRATEGRTDRKNLSRGARALAGGATVGLLILLVWFVSWPGPGGGEGKDSAETVPTDSPITSVAILPFVDMSEGDHEYFSDGITEEILSNLAGVPELRVISRTSVVRYKDADKSLREIGRELGATHIVEGAVRRSGDRVRVSAQLIDAETDHHLWAESYDRDLEDIFLLQSDISSEIVAALRAALPGADLPAVAFPAAPTEDVEAYQLYLLGRYLFQTRPRLLEGPKRSIEYFQRALELDPGFARAWAGMGLAYTILAGYPPDLTEVDDAAERAEAALKRALELDSTVGEAHAALGLWYANATRWTEAEESFLRAIRAEPQSATTHLWYGILLVGTGRTQRALDLLLKATELDPVNAITAHWLADAFRNAGRLEESRSHARRSVELGMESSGIGLYIYHLLSGEWEEAILHQERAAEREGIDPAFVRPIVEAVRDSKNIPHAVEVAARVAAEHPRLVPVFFYYDLEAPNLVFDGIDRLFREGRGMFALWRMWEPQHTPLRNDPRFRALAERVGLLDFWGERGWPDLCRPEGDGFTCD